MTLSEEIRVTILGTGTSQGIPVIGCTCAVCTSPDSRDKRQRSSAMISVGDTRILIDAGPDFRQQMLAQGFNRLDAILLTHEHNDHLSGLDDVRPLNFRQKSDIPVYGLPRVLDAVKRRFDYVFDPQYAYPGLPRLQLVPLAPGPLTIAGIALEAVAVRHGSLDILGYRFGDFCYITDAKTIPARESGLLDGLHTLCLNALHRKEHFSHLNLEEALEMAATIGARQTWLTHMSHDMGRHAVVEKELPPGIGLAYDGLSISVPR